MPMVEAVEAMTNNELMSYARNHIAESKKSDYYSIGIEFLFCSFRAFLSYTSYAFVANTAVGRLNLL